MAVGKHLRNASGREPRNGDGKACRNAAGGTIACCPTTLTWFALIPCSLALPAVGTTQCCAGNPADCLWITQAKYCEILQDAVDAGYIPAACVIGSAPDCTVTIDPADGCDVTVPDYLVLFNEDTQACYRLYLREPDGAGVAFGTFCTERTGNLPPNGEDQSDFVFLVGTSCCDTPCPCDGGTPVTPDPDPNPYEDPDCGTVTNVVASVNVTACDCVTSFNFFSFTGMNQTVGLRHIGAGVWQGSYRMTQHSCPPGFEETWLVKVTATLHGASGWSATAIAYRFFGGVWNSTGGGPANCPTPNGDCHGGSPANSYTGCGATQYGFNGTIDISATVVP